MSIGTAIRISLTTSSINKPTHDDKEENYQENFFFHYLASIQSPDS